jgi:flavin reductase (DIM6/NTAB) family NADH-FMN oxidoreductase RutF
VAIQLSEATQLDTERYVRIMGTLASGVCIVTVSDELDNPSGLTTTSVVSISASPPILAVAFGADSRTLPLVLATGRFCVNVMADGTADICRVFASKADDKFDAVSWYRGVTGSPVFDEGVLAVAECEVAETFTIADHVLVTGLVVGGGAHREGGEPTVYYKRDFHGLASSGPSSGRAVRRAR